MKHQLHSHPRVKISRLCRWTVFVAFATLAGCGGAPSSADDHCPSAPGVSGSPGSIAEAVAMANALYAARIHDDDPLTLPCFVQRLARPLSTVAVTGQISLQPADGARSPRIFLFSGSLVMSVAPSGAGNPFLELAEYTTSPTRSIKAQMEFPLTAPLPLADPYDSIREKAGTVCGGCHRDEVQSTSVTFTQGFESSVFRPLPSEQVPLLYLQDQTRTCDPKAEPARCEMLDAVYNHGNVTVGSFSPDAETIYD
jgi:hypothetical protein